MNTPTSRPVEHHRRAAPAVVRGEAGFVLAMVIFVLAALSVGGTAAFMLVQSESRMVDGGVDGTRAFQLAQAGLQRYLADHIGPTPGTRSYDMGGATVSVRADQMLSFGDELTGVDTLRLFVLTAEASIADRRGSASPARRSVRQLALMDSRGVRPSGALTLANSGVTLNTSTVDGNDACAVAAPPIAGVSALNGASVQESGTTIDGTPRIGFLPDIASMEAALGFEWDVLTDPTIPFEYDLAPGSGWPSFFAIGSSEYPTIRWDGDLSVSGSHSGRGLLIVTGSIRFYEGFTWDGVIISGDMHGNWDKQYEIHGALITGMDAAAGAAPGELIIGSNGTFRYNSCHVAAAGRGLSRLVAVENTWWEVE